MPEPTPDLRDRIDKISERVTKIEGRLDSHEMLNDQRYNTIIEKITEVRLNLDKASIEFKTNLDKMSKIGFIIAMMLFAVELGKATFPQILDVVMKGH